MEDGRASLQSTMRTGKTVDKLELPPIPRKSSLQIAKNFLKSASNSFVDRLLGPPDLRLPSQNDDADDDDSEQGEKLSRHEIKKQIRLERATQNRASQRKLILMKTMENEQSEKSGLGFRGWNIWRVLGVTRLLNAVHQQRLMVEVLPPKYPEIHKLANSIKFELTMGAFIILNALTIGWSTFFEAGAEPNLLHISEHVFTALFIVEFFTRVLAHSWVWMFSWANAADTFLVWIGGVFVTWILVPAGADGTVLKMFTALRILRLVRVCRVIRLHPAFKDLWVLVKGLSESLNLVLWFYIIVGTIHFMFAVAVMETLSIRESKDEKLLGWFGDPVNSMFTLFQIMTYDSYSVIVRHLLSRDKIPLMPLALIFFFIGIAAIVLFNLMTAIVVEIAFAARAKDEEAMLVNRDLEKKVKVAKLKVVFKEMDEDNSGFLTKEEFTDVLDDPGFVQQMKILDIEVDELGDIFQILDDGDGKVSANEFCDGLVKMGVPASNANVYKATRVTSRVSKRIYELANQMDDIADNESVFKYLDRANEDKKALIASCSTILAGLNVLGSRKMLRELRTTGLMPSVADPNTLELPYPPPKGTPKEVLWVQKHYRARLEAEKRAAQIAEGKLPDEPASYEEPPSIQQLHPEKSQKRESRTGRSRKSFSKRRSSLAELPDVHKIPPVPESLASSWAQLGLSFNNVGDYRPPDMPSFIAAPPLPPTQPQATEPVPPPPQGTEFEMPPAPPAGDPAPVFIQQEATQAGRRVAVPASQTIRFGTDSARRGSKGRVAPKPATPTGGPAPPIPPLPAQPPAPRGAPQALRTPFAL